MKLRSFIAYNKEKASNTELLFAVLTLVQACFAAIWFAGNVGTYIPETLSENYLAAARTLIVDDYMGIVYALLIKILHFLPLLYVFQFVIILGAGSYACSVFAFPPVLALYLATSPFVMQSVCTVLPGPVLTALLIVMIASLKRFHDEKKPGNAVLAAAALFLMGLTEPRAGYFASAFTVPLLIYFLIAHKKKGMMPVLFNAVATLAAAVSNSFVCKVRAYGRGEGTISAQFMQRMMWPRFLQYASFFDGQEDLLYEINSVPERLAEGLTSVIGLYMSRKQTNEYFREIAFSALRTDTSGIFLRLLRHILSVVFAPLSVPVLIVTGAGDTMITANISDFTRSLPHLSTVYLYYSMALVLFVAVLAGVNVIVKKAGGLGRTALIFGLYSICCAAVYLVLMRLPCFDARCTAFVLFVWTGLFAGTFLKGNK